MEKAMATHSSILAWRILWTKEPGRLQSIGSHKVGHNWRDLVHTQTIHLWWILMQKIFNKMFASWIQQYKVGDTPWSSCSDSRAARIVQRMQMNHCGTPHKQRGRQTLHDHLNRRKKGIWQNSTSLYDKNPHQHGYQFSSVQFSHSVVSNSLWPHGLQHTRSPVHHQLLEFTQTHAHWVSDAIQPSHLL